MIKLKKSNKINLKMKLRERVNTLLDDTYNHYTCYLPKKFGIITSSVLRFLFSGIRIKEDQIDHIKQIPEDALIVYVSKFKSKFAYLYYHIIYHKKNLPPPEVGFDYKILLLQPISRMIKIFISHVDFFLKNLTFPNPYNSGYIADELIKGKTGFLSLIEKGGFHRRFVKAKTDPILYLIEIQQSTDRAIFIVPQLMFFSTKPQRVNPSLVDMLFGTEENPGKIRRLVILFTKPSKVFVEISQPVNLKILLSHQDNAGLSIEHQAMNIRQTLLTGLNQHKNSITGPALQSREEMKENILTTGRFREFMNNYSAARNIPSHEVRKKADAYLEEIAANYSIRLIKIVAVIVGWIMNIMFEGVTTNNDSLTKIKTMSQKGPLVLIPNHKSHIDYLILSYVLYKNKMPCPHIAAGKNLSFWPMGPIFRGGGAFFIRRTFRGAVLYSKVFTEYIYKLLKDGFNIEFFIEGTRSRTGKLVLPKLGLLSILLEAYRNGACKDMTFVPIYIGYDRVLEEKSYINEIEGQKKEPENLLQVIRARKFLKRRYGKVYIQFHDPLSINDLFTQWGKTLAEMEAKEKNAFCRNLGHRIINSINKATVVTAHGLLASAALNLSGNNFSFEKIKAVVETYITYLYSNDAKLADTLYMDQDHTIQNAFDSYVQRKLIEPVPRTVDNPDTARLFFVKKDKRTALEYYKNNCIAFFIPAAITAIEILVKDAFQFSITDIHKGYSFLQELFKNEFAYDIDKTPEYHVQKSIKSFVNEAAVTPHQTLPDTYNITSEGLRKLKLFSGFLKTYFETYCVVLDVLKNNSRESLNPKERLRKIEATGIRMYKQKEIERKEALSKVTYQNAIDFFNSRKIKGSEDHVEIEVFDHAIKRYLDKLQP